ncbi:MAG: FRG domain-containing protein [Phycisphaerae bacterium]|nr:FRG domain-containing protein [Phycisphaerae bacterium]MDD5381139.1 FRG domain-containing protein [Phycisphaerae bacterium]
MSKTNIKQQYQYKVDDAWRAVEPTNADDCWERFIKLSISGKVECHGVPQDWKCIRSSFDFRCENKIPAEKRTEVETSLLESFRKEADPHPHFPPEARRFLDVANSKWRKFRNTGTVFVGRHYGLPTRCVDWTSDPFIALFFACRHNPEEPGVVWWMDYNVFSYAIATQWMPFYGKYEFVTDDFEKDFTNGEDKEILIRFHYLCLLERPIKQKAWIIMSGQYDVHHDKEIHRLGVRKCGRFIISPQMKSDLLKKLDRWGINCATLGIHEGDLCLEKIAADISNKHGLSPPIIL